MYCEVVSVEALEAYKIKVKFSDSLEGIVNISKKWLTGVFEPLVDMNVFRKVYVDMESGAVTWDINGEPVDLAPDTMYNEIKNNNGVYDLK